jgi:hypothetical protein
MSEALRVAVVAEGPTDKFVISAAISAVIGEKPFILRQLQPEESHAFAQAISGGWGGVYRWCRQATLRNGGAIRHDPLFLTYDLLILHLDAEVANENYANAGIVDAVNDLPCSQPCPPPEDSTNALRNVMLRWIGEADPPPKTVFCTPSKKTETWVLCALYPEDPWVASADLECFPNPDHSLQAKPMVGRLITGGKKIVRVYAERSREITRAWNQVRARCSEAERLSNDLMAFV